MEGYFYSIKISSVAWCFLNINPLFAFIVHLFFPLSSTLKCKYEVSFLDMERKI